MSAEHGSKFAALSLVMVILFPFNALLSPYDLENFNCIMTGAFPLIKATIQWTSFGLIFHLYGDVTIAGEGLQNLGLCSALWAFEQGGIFIVPRLL
jgi:hypothetical protein